MMDSDAMIRDSGDASTQIAATGVVISSTDERAQGGADVQADENAARASLAVQRDGDAAADARDELEARGEDATDHEKGDDQHADTDKLASADVVGRASAERTQAGGAVGNEVVPDAASALQASSVAEAESSWATAFDAALAGRFSMNITAILAKGTGGRQPSRMASRNSVTQRYSGPAAGVHSTSPPASRAAVSRATQRSMQPGTSLPRSQTPTALVGLGAPGQMRSLSSALHRARDASPDSAGSSPRTRAAQDAAEQEMLRRMMHSPRSHAAELAQQASPHKSDLGVHAKNFSRSLRSGRPLGAAAERPVWPRTIAASLAESAGLERDELAAQRTAARQLYRLQAKHRQHTDEVRSALEHAKHAADAKRKDVLQRPLSKWTDELDAGAAVLAEVSASILDKEEEQRTNRLRAWHRVWNDSVYQRMQRELQEVTAGASARKPNETAHLHSTRGQLDAVDPTRLPLTRKQRELASVGQTSQVSALRQHGAIVEPDGKYHIVAPQGITQVPELQPLDAALVQAMNTARSTARSGGASAYALHSAAPSSAASALDATAFIGLDDALSFASSSGTSQASSRVVTASRDRSAVASVANAALHAASSDQRGVSFSSRAAEIAAAPPAPSSAATSVAGAARKQHAGSTPFAAVPGAQASHRLASSSSAAGASIARSPSAQALHALADSMRRVSIITAKSAFFDGSAGAMSARSSASAGPRATGAPVPALRVHDSAGAALAGLHSPIRADARAEPVRTYGIAKYYAASTAPRASNAGAHESGVRRQAEQGLLAADATSRPVLHPKVWMTGKIEDTTFVREWKLVGDGLIGAEHPVAREFAATGEMHAEQQRTRLLGGHDAPPLAPGELKRVALAEAAGYGPGYRGKKRVPAPVGQPDLDSVVHPRRVNPVLERRAAEAAAAMRDIMTGAIVPMPKPHPSLRRVEGSAFDVDHVAENFTALARMLSEEQA